MSIYHHFQETVFFDVVFLSGSNDDAFVKLRIHSNKTDSFVVDLTYDSSVDHVYNITPYTADDTWLGNETFRIVQFLYGTDATNASLISWIQSNAEQIVDSAPPPSFSDVEVTPHDSYITMTINGVDFNLKTAASVSLISFSIGGTTYQAEEGMTWAEWVASDYNTGGFYISGTGVFTQNNFRVVDSATFSYVNSSDEIVQNHSYAGSRE